MKEIRFFYIVSIIFFVGCSEDYIGQYAMDSVPPGPVSSVSVENIPGGSVISYVIPNDEDFAYVKATYQANGQLKEQKSSAFKQSIKLEGFGKSETQRIELVAYDKSENPSSPVHVDIHPLDAPVFGLIETIVVKDDFGGIRVDWENIHRSEVVLAVLTPATMESSVEEWVEAGRTYSSSIQGGYNVRGFNDSERFFGLYFRDRWDNFSDTLYIKGHPLYEEQLDKSKFTRWNPQGIPYNAYTSNNWWIENLWDGLIGNSSTPANQGFASFNHDITFDMGQLAILSRIRINQRPDLTYDFAHPKKFQIWGSSHPNVNADFSNWTFLGEFESIKPSGLPGLGEINEDDKNYAWQNGEEWNFPVNLPAVRYIRWYVTETWGGSQEAQVMEMTLWGNIQ